MKTLIPDQHSLPEDFAEPDLETTELDLTLEKDLADWLARQSRKLRIPSSVIVSALLEWARDEDILQGDPAFFPQLTAGKPRRP
jgi:hypothetical protein